MIRAGSCRYGRARRRRVTIGELEVITDQRAVFGAVASDSRVWGLLDRLVNLRTGLDV